MAKKPKDFRVRPKWKGFPLVRCEDACQLTEHIKVPPTIYICNTDDLNSKQAKRLAKWLETAIVWLEKAEKQK